MISKKNLNYIYKGIQEELLQRSSISDHRYYTCILYAWYIKYGDNALSDYILEDVAHSWKKYFKSCDLKSKQNQNSKR